jgi:hypothetical protein
VTADGTEQEDQPAQAEREQNHVAEAAEEAGEKAAHRSPPGLRLVAGRSAEDELAGEALAREALQRIATRRRVA